VTYQIKEIPMAFTLDDEVTKALDPIAAAMADAFLLRSAMWIQGDVSFREAGVTVESISALVRLTSARPTSTSPTSPAAPSPIGFVS
jgi:hypothetical protein